MDEDTQLPPIKLSFPANSPTESQELVQQLVEDETFKLRFPVLADALTLNSNMSAKETVLTVNVNEENEEDATGASSFIRNDTRDTIPTTVVGHTISETHSHINNESNDITTLPDITHPTHSNIINEESTSPHMPNEHTIRPIPEDKTHGVTMSDMTRMSQPLQGLGPTDTPLYFIQRLHDIEAAYSHIIGKRHTVKYFHDLLRQTSAHRSIQHTPPIVLKSRFERTAEIQCPTATLQSRIGIPWDISSTHHGMSDSFGPTTDLQHSSEFFKYPDGTAPNLHYVLNTSLSANQRKEETTSLINKEFVLDGLQTMPKPNPALLFHKEGCDMSVNHIEQHAKSIRHRTNEIDRRLKQFHYKKEYEGLEAVGANMTLNELLHAQRELVAEQEREKEDIIEDGILLSSEMNSIVRHIRGDFYSQLYSTCEEPDELRYYRNRAKNLQTSVQDITHLKDKFYQASNSSTTIKQLIDSGQMTVLQKNNSQHMSLPSKQDIHDVIHTVGYSKTPVLVPGYHQLRSNFPNIYPKSVYDHSISGRSLWSQSQHKKRWETLGQPEFVDIQESLKSSKKLSFEKTTNNRQQQRDKSNALKQFDQRIDDDNWNDYIEPSKQSQLDTTSRIPSTVIIPHLPKHTSSETIVEKVSEKIPNSAIVHIADNNKTQLPQEKDMILHRADTKPLVKIIVNRPPVEQRQAKISTSNLSKRLPRRQCKDYVNIDPWETPLSLPQLHDHLKKSINQGRLGLPDVAKILFQFATCCQEPEALQSIHAKEYANLLTECLPYYPLQLDLLDIGLVALLKIYECYTQQAMLTDSYVSCFTSLMAVDESILRSQLIAAISVVMEKPGTVPLSTDLVDFLLTILGKFDNSELSEHALKILSIACVGHRKADQYGLFVSCLEHFRHDPRVLTRGCLAIDSFAQRAESETRRSQTRQISVSGITHQTEMQMHHGTLLRQPFTIPKKPVTWIPQDGSDIVIICKIMDMHPLHRKLQGAASTCIASLIKVSELHALMVMKEGWRLLFDALKHHATSQSITISIATIIEYLALLETTQSYVLTEGTVKIMIELIQRHQVSSDVVACCFTTLVALEPALQSTFDLFPASILELFLTIMKQFKTDNALAASFCCFLAIMATVTQIVNIQQQLVELGAIEVSFQILLDCKLDPKAVESASRAIARLVYKNPGASRHVDVLPITSTFMMLLMKHMKSLDLSLVIINCLKCNIAICDTVVKDVESGHFVILQQVLELATKEHHQDIRVELANVLREINKKKSLLRDQETLSSFRHLTTQLQTITGKK